MAAALMMFAFTSCGDPRYDNYRRSVDCLGNELVLHTYIDQQSEPAMMMPEDRKRFLRFERKAAEYGRALNIDHEQIQRDVERSADNARKRVNDLSIGDAATAEYRQSRRCEQLLGVEPASGH